MTVTRVKRKEMTRVNNQIVKRNLHVYGDSKITNMHCNRLLPVDRRYAKR